MAKKTTPTLPSSAELLRQFGNRLRLARLRRRLTAKQVAERAGMAPMTLRNVERGEAGVTMGAYLAVMQVLGIEQDLDFLGKEDPLGRELQDARLPVRALQGSPRKALENMSQEPPRKKRESQPIKPSQKIQADNYVSAQELVDLLDPVAPPSSSKKRR